MENILCKYGCGQVARFQLKNGSMSCSKNPSSCPSIRKKFSESNCMKRPEMRIIAGNAMRGKKRDPEVIKIVAEKLRGRKHSEETKKKISFKTKGRIIPAHQRQMMIDNNPMKNPINKEKHRIAMSRPETRQKISEHCGMRRPEVAAKISGNKSISRRPERRAQQSKLMKDRNPMRDPEIALKVAQQLIGREVSLETRQKMSEAQRLLGRSGENNPC